jgi:NAD(P)H-hydrate epimerase
MIKLVTAQQMRDLDAKTINDVGIPGVVLMELAGQGAFKFIEEQNWLPSKNHPVLILAGKGNNGGDALVVSRWLRLAGYTNVRVVLLAEAALIGGDAKVNLDSYQNLGGAVVEITTIEAWDDFYRQAGKFSLVVDGILGTGLKSSLRGLYAAVISMINKLGEHVLALDISSGLHADRGVPLGDAVKADATVTFGYGKTGLFVYPGKEYAGNVKIIDIGIPSIFLDSLETTKLLTTAGCRKLLPPAPALNGHKGNRGHLLTIAGSRGKSGAALYTAYSALKTGCGLSTLAIPSSLAASIEGRIPELMMLPITDDGQGRVGEMNVPDIEQICRGKQAIAVGPGLGTQAEAHKLIMKLLKNIPIPMVLDADALTVLALSLEALSQKKTEIILTPHPGEMSSLLKIPTREVQQNRLEMARDFACRHNVYLVLKGAGTIIAAPDGNTAINRSGNQYLATAGSGDILTGIIGSFLAQGLSPLSACHLGVYVHGLTADILAKAENNHGITAGDLLQTIPQALKAIEKDSI